MLPEDPVRSRRAGFPAPAFARSCRWTPPLNGGGRRWATANRSTAPTRKVVNSWSSPTGTFATGGIRTAPDSRPFRARSRHIRSSGGGGVHRSPGLTANPAEGCRQEREAAGGPCPRRARRASPRSAVAGCARRTTGWLRRPCSRSALPRVNTWRGRIRSCGWRGEETLPSARRSRDRERRSELRSAGWSG